MARSIEVEIVADTRGFRRGLLKAESACTRSRWRRLVLRFRLWRIEREDAP